MSGPAWQKVDEFLRQAREPDQEKPRDNTLKLPPMPKVITASELEGMSFPEPRWLVPGIIPEGVTILAGKPKLGKSYLALNIALALACGGKAMGSIDVSPCGVLYLALEDRHRRLQNRINETFGQCGWPSRLHLVTEWPRVDQGGIPLLQKFLEEHTNVKLVIIDVFEKFKAREQKNDRIYSQDYQHMEPLVSLTHSHDVSLLPVHHTRKLVADDPLDEVSGSTGLSGSADTILVLKRVRGKATLYVRGRDVEEQELELDRDPSGGWVLLGGARAVEVNAECQALLDLLKRGPMKLTVMSAVMEQAKSTVHKRLGALMDASLVRQNTDGRYEAI